MAREAGGPAWPGVATRWQTEFELERLADNDPALLQPKRYAAYLALLAGSVEARARRTPRFEAHSGPSASPDDLRGDCCPGAWVEATGILQGDLVASWK